MKNNYILYITLLIVILSRDNILNLTTNLTNNLFAQNDNLEIKLLKEKNEYLKYSFDSLIDFKSNINIEYYYTITNIVRNNYGLNNIIISGTDYIVGDEVVTENGLIGIISSTSWKTSNIKLLHNTNIVVNIGEETGKITGRDEEGNLIIKEVSNYNNIKLNDKVYSMHNTLIGRVIKIKYEVIDNYIIVKTQNIDNIKYVAVISRQL